MTLLILAYLAGILTILSPCILPVLPFVFSRADQPFLRTGLPQLLGMAVAFMGVATLAATGGGWAIETNQYGRLAASTTAPIDDAASSSVSAHGQQSWVLPPAPRIDSLALIDVLFREPSLVPAEVDPVTKITTGTKTDLPVEGALPDFSGITEWLNSTPLTAQALRGKVVLVNFWTFNCINCLNALPYVRAWAEKYRDHGLVVIGVHTPELPFEKDIGNVRKAVARLKIDYPVVIDNGYAIWKAFGNEYWPAAYFVDAEGRIRHHHFGEHDYENSERVIQKLLMEAGNRNVPSGYVTAFP